ncbi:MAG: radical SAM/SPASM domain-containing protein [Desulfomonilaceae bacterium]
MISSLLKNAAIEERDVRAAGERLGKPKSVLSLSPDCSLKRLEKYYVYHIAHDDLYEVNEDGFRFLESCETGEQSKDIEPDPDFVEYCIEEGLLVQGPVVHRRRVWAEAAPVPSLRYLEWLVTRKCNLKCAHCYLGESTDVEFPRELIDPLLSQFSGMQGLRVLVSGGEPTVYRHFQFLNDIIDQYPLRFVLLTNGFTLDASLAKRLKFHEVQISLDGMKRGHEAIRGEGTFSRALQAMESVKAAGLDLSVATMVHRENLSEWDEMQALVERYGVKEWNIDYPCKRGRWELHPDLYVEETIAAARMKYGFGGSYHGTDHGWTCGRHLAAVLPPGDVCRCALYSDVVVGHVTTGLREAWRRVQHIPISETACNGCVHADECGGGCRYRAGDVHAKDSVMCALFLTDSP